MTHYRRWKGAAKFATKLEEEYNQDYIDFFMENYRSMGHSDPCRIFSDPAVTKDRRKLFKFSRDGDKTVIQYKHHTCRIYDPYRYMETVMDCRNPNYGKEVFDNFFENNKNDMKESFIQAGGPGWNISFSLGIAVTTSHITMDMIVGLVGLENLKGFMNRICIGEGPRYSLDEIEKYKDHLSWSYILKTYPKVNQDFLDTYQEEIERYFLLKYPLSINRASITITVFSNLEIDESLFFSCMRYLDNMSPTETGYLCAFFRLVDITSYTYKMREFSYDTYKRVLIDGDSSIFRSFCLLKNKMIPESILQTLIEREDGKLNLKLNFYKNMTLEQYLLLGVNKSRYNIAEIKGYGYKQYLESGKVFGLPKLNSSVCGKEQFFENEFRKYMAVRKIKNLWKKWYDSLSGPGPEKYWNEFCSMTEEL